MRAAGPKTELSHNNPDGLYHFGRLAYLGRLGQQNKNLAPNYWSKAVEYGSKKSAFCLAKLYLRGEFVEQDLKCAYILASLSEELPESAKLLDQIKMSLSPNLNAISSLRLSAKNFSIKVSELKQGRNAGQVPREETTGEKTSWDLIVEKLASIRPDQSDRPQ